MEKREENAPGKWKPTICSGQIHPQAIIGLELFNQRHYFECHEALEFAWLAETGQVRELYRGILQIAVAYLHIERQNYRGARKMFKRCRPWLAPFPDTCLGINVGKLKKDYKSVEAAVISLGPDGIGNLDPALMKPIEWALPSK